MPPQPSSALGRPLRRALAAATAAMFLASSAVANSDFSAGFPDDNATSHPAVDLLALRPLGLVAFASGVGLFIPAMLLTAITRPMEMDQPFNWLIVEPARYVWADPLGAH